MIRKKSTEDIIIAEQKYCNFGWAWRDPKYKSETELCAMLKWAKEKGLTIEELSI